MKTILITGIIGFFYCSVSFATNDKLQSEYPEIPMETGNAFSMPYGIGGTDSGRVMCPNKKPAPEGIVSKCEGISAQAINLQNYISSSYVNAPACKIIFDGKKQHYPSIQDPNSKIGEKPDACGYGDMTLFNGLICAGDVFGYGWSASESIACQAVKDAQDADGRMWRSPYRKLVNSFNEVNTFSPDMDLGVLLYAVAANDKALLQKWWNWIHQTTPCIQEQLLGPGCLLRNLPRYCDDEACSLRPWDIRIIEEVASFFNLELPGQLKNYEKTLGSFIGLIPGAQNFIENLTTSHYIALSTTLSDPGFPLHLEGVRIFLLKLMQKGEERYLDLAIKNLVRRQPENPFFSYLNDGGPNKTLSKNTVDLFNKKCLIQHISEKDAHEQWAWQRADKDQAWLNGSLWECRFLAQFIYANNP